jgi:peptidoglycan/LPS O-acetylase OafA/YrhL
LHDGELLVGVSEVEHFGRHRNAFGFLRLLFASLVIVSHATELFDGNREREPLTRLFGTISFGDLAVDGFFIISGYLVVGSYLKRPAIGEYLLTQARRLSREAVNAGIVGSAKS